MRPPFRASSSSSISFQSTHPARGATTWSDIFISAKKQFQSTHPARGATCDRSVTQGSSGISIHAPREGCDFLFLILVLSRTYFNPRTPRGVRRCVTVAVRNISTISIHAPREGCDHPASLIPFRSMGFQSTHPARGATYHVVSVHLSAVFQSTHPARGATCSWPDFPGDLRYFNPRTPRGVRRRTVIHILAHVNFNPRTPRGVRLGMMRPSLMRTLFQSTHPARGATRWTGCRCSGSHNFNPRTPRGVRLRQPSRIPR